jgi:hypothetical protein
LWLCLRREDGDDALVGQDQVPVLRNARRQSDRVLVRSDTRNRELSDLTDRLRNFSLDQIATERS